MTTAVVKIVNSLVSQQVIIIEEQTVHTQTIGQFELVAHVPVVLNIGTRTIELYTGSRLRLTVITIGQTDDLGCNTIHEIIH